MLWGDEVPDTAPATLQAYVSRLRRLLPAGAQIVTKAPGYRLWVAAGATDRREPGLSMLEKLVRASCARSRSTVGRNCSSTSARTSDRPGGCTSSPPFYLVGTRIDVRPADSLKRAAAAEAIPL